MKDLFDRLTPLWQMTQSSESCASILRVSGGGAFLRGGPSIFRPRE